MEKCERLKKEEFIKMIKIFQRIKSMSSPQKSAFAYMFASFIQQGISFIITPLFTRLLTTLEFGQVSVYNSWVEILAPLATLSLYSGVFNVGMVDYEKKRDEFVCSMLLLSNCATILVITMFGIINKFFPDMIGLSNELFLLMGIYFLFYPAMRLWSAKQRFEYKYKKLTIVTIISALLSSIFAVIFVVFNQSRNRGTAKLLGSNIIIIIIGIFFYVTIVKKSRKFIIKEYWKYALRFSIPLIPHYLAMHILAASDKIMIKNLIGESEAGIYSLAYTASMVITVAWTAINGSLSPYVMNCLKHDKLNNISKVAMPCIILFSILCLLVTLVAPEIIYILGGEEYMEAVSLIPVLLASVLFMEMYNLFSFVEFYYKKTKKIMMATVIASIINILLNYIFISSLGYKAAAYTTLFCYALYCWFHYLNMRSIEKRKIYDEKFLFVFSLIYLVICFAILFLYDYIILRYCVLFFLCLFIYLFRKKILIFYERIKK